MHYFALLPHNNSSVVLTADQPSDDAPTSPHPDSHTSVGGGVLRVCVCVFESNSSTPLSILVWRALNFNLCRTTPYVHVTYPTSPYDVGSHSMFARRGGKSNRSVIIQYQCETHPLVSRPSSLWLEGALFVVTEYLQSFVASNGPCPWGFNLASTQTQGRRRSD